MKRLIHFFITTALSIIVVSTMCSCRDTVRYLINKWGAPASEQPPTYHAVEGFSPSKHKKRGIENHERYYYYISPDPKEMLPTYQPSVNYDYSSEYEPFDEEKYWKENHLEFPEVDDADYYNHLDINE